MDDVARMHIPVDGIDRIAYDQMEVLFVDVVPKALPCLVRLANPRKNRDVETPYLVQINQEHRDVRSDHSCCAGNVNAAVVDCPPTGPRIEYLVHVLQYDLVF